MLLVRTKLKVGVERTRSMLEGIQWCLDNDRCLESIEKKDINPCVSQRGRIFCSLGMKRSPR